MALTTTYSINPLLTRILPAADPAENSDTVGFSNGGFATVADAPSGAESAIYDAAGTITAMIGLSLTDNKIAQLTNGNVVFAGTRSGGGIDFVIMPPTGVVTGGTITSDTRASNADVAALGGGGFVVVDQYDYTADTPGDRDIVVHIRDAFGVLQTFTVDSSTANDQNASVAGLADGGFVVAWERIGAGGNSAAWYATYDADGTPRLAPSQLDGTGTINHQMSVTALQDGGFAIAYQDNVSDGVQSDIRVVMFDTSGNRFFGWADFLGTNDSEAAVTTLSNGMVMSTFTNDILDGGEFRDSDIRGTLFDSTNGNPLTSQGDPLVIDASGDINSQSSISAMGLAQFVVSYSSLMTGDVTQKTFQLQRTVTGDAADDTFAGDDAVDIVNGLDGNDTLAGGANGDTLNGGGGADYLNGGTGNDLLSGGANNDFLVGGDGVDNLNGGTGADSLLGGLGSDTYIGDNASDEVSETSALATEIDTVESSVTYTLGANLENLTLTGPSAINGTGNALANTIAGNAAANTLSGLAGNDTYFVNNLGDVVIEGTGQGTADIIAASVSYIMDASAQVETLRTIADAGISAINLTGNGFSQTIVGNNGANVINGGGGADILQGLGGSDTYFVDSLDDLVTEGLGQGTDGVRASVSYALTAGSEIETLITTNSAATTAIDLTGNALKQSITGNAGVNVLSDGGVGAADTMSGLGGNDTYRVYNAGDVIVETSTQGTADRVTTAVDYVLGKGVFIELLTTNGSTGTLDIDLTGNEVVQEIIGNAGDNRLEGKGGSDTLRGLSGDDTFVFASTLGAANVDTILDFNVAADRFLLSDAIFTALAPGVLSAAAFRANTTGLAQDASDRIVYETDTGELYYDANGSGAGGGILFATITANLALTNADFSVA